MGPRVGVRVNAVSGDRVTVIGLDGAAPSAEALAALAEARLVIGGRRHLDAVPIAGDAERIMLGPMEPALAALAEPGRRAVVLASGDPGFFGIVRLLREHGHRPRVLPAPSSVATLAARIGRSWDDLAVVSAHGRDLTPAVNVCRARSATAVLTAPGAGPAEVGAALDGWQRTLVVGEDLGGPAERVTVLDPAAAAARSWHPASVLLCLRDPDAIPDRGWLAGGTPVPDTGAGPDPGWRADAGWALPDDAFEHRGGMITKAEVRAVVLARLGPGPGTLVWDVGAGSGSVAVECSRFGAAVVAVERRADDVARITANATRHGADVRVVTGQAPAVLAGLPRPDAVFVGGGGPEVVAVAAASGATRVVVALAALDRVGVSRATLAAAGLTVEGVQLAASRLAALPDGSVRLAAENPIIVLWGMAA